MKTLTKASLSDVMTSWEKSGAEVACRIAQESIVLLENDGALPIAPCRVALFGAGATMTIKGGTGSGEVNDRDVVTIARGLEEAGFTLSTKAWLSEYEGVYRRGEEEYGRIFRKKLRQLKVTELINIMRDPYRYPFGQPITEQDIADSDTDTCIYVVARQAGEGADRKLDRYDYSLSPQELENIALCAGRYEKLILVLNVGGVFDMGFLDQISGINAVVFYAQQGNQGGAALADILSGRVSPSGKLADTWPMKYEDIPFAREYSYLNGQLDQEYYKEDFYVGYRYFDTFGVAPRYAFGFGLSYTTFALAFKEIRKEKGSIFIQVSVTNMGQKYSGREVVQLYASCPQSRTLPKEYQRLVAFAKTGVLAPGDTQTLVLCFDADALASFRYGDAATVLEAGNYILRMGNSSRSTVACACVRVSEELILQRHRHICPERSGMQTIQAPELCHEQPVLPSVQLCSDDIVRQTRGLPNEAPQINAVLDGLSVKEQVRLCVGGGMFRPRAVDAPGAAGVTTGKLAHKGVPSIVMADGPAGVRVQQSSVLLKNGTIKPVEPPMAVMNYLPGFVKKVLLGDPRKGKLLHQFTTSFPVELAVAQTWNTELAREMGMAVSAQMSAYGIRCWLAPALNIHRNPLCGRNFEYYSEDPLLSGLFAAAVTQGVQSIPGNLVTLKHFACNNQEDNRNRTNANVTERALREIYLRGFEIAVRNAQPGAVMTSYNLLNGVYTPNSSDLLETVLRQEWGFTGFVMTDWLSTGKGLGDNVQALLAGNDLIMPGSGSVERQLRAAVKKGTLSPEALRRCAGNILRGIL